MRSLFGLCLLVAVVYGASAAATGYQSNKKVVCYYGSWATYREGNGKCDVEDIEPTLCTHLIYTFVGLSENGDVKILDPWADLPDNYGLNGYGRFNALKKRNPDLKTLIAIGGWNEGSIKYSLVMNDPQLRARFVQKAVEFVKKYNFDGLDFDWEYPNQRGGVASDVDAYVQVLKQLREAFDQNGLLLTGAVGAAKSSASLSYNIKEISKYYDFIHLMAYDLHGSWDNYIGLNAPLYGRADETPEIRNNLNVEASVEYWLSEGADPAKLILGMPLYGRTFRLTDATKFQPGDGASGPGVSGKYTREEGMIGYNEICEMDNSAWRKYWDAEQVAPYMVKGNDWIGYDNDLSIYRKTQYAMEKGLGGVMVWSVETDDFRGICGEKYPLMNSIHRALNGNDPMPTTISTEGPSDPTEPTTAEPTEKPTVLPPDSDICTDSGMVRDPDDCSVFYNCVLIPGGEYKPYKFNCPDGLYFNNDILNCDYPENVDC